MKIASLIICLSLTACASGSILLFQVEKEDDFFLCFPTTKNSFSMLTLEDKIQIQKQITLEKERRDLNCEQFTDLTSAEQHLKNINQEEMNRRLNWCTYRGEPCRYE